MKVAFLFLTRGDLNKPVIWESFFETAPNEQYRVYCHPKFPKSLTSKVLKGKAIPMNVETNYGHISLVIATMFLLQEAYKDPENEYFVLLSESCVPLYTFEATRNFLTELGKSIITYHPTEKPEDERRYQALTEPEFIPREKFFKQAQWMCLHRDAVKVLLENDYTAVFSEMYVPDEHYFISTLIKTQFPVETKVHNHFMTFANWRDYEYKRVPENIVNGEIIYRREVRPKTYHSVSYEDFENARKAGCIFFRKIAEDCIISPQPE